MKSGPSSTAAAYGRLGRAAYQTTIQECLDAFLKWARKFGFCNENVAKLLDKADARLFRLVQRTLSSSSFTVHY